ncbi:MAG: hypothetical protein ABR599_12505 [Gemmatimonadota bacterium]
MDIDQDGEELEAVDRDQMNFPFEGEIDDLGNVELSASITDTVEITSGNDTIPARRTTTVNLDLRRSADGERLSGDVRVDEAFTLIAGNEFLSTCTQVGTMVLTRQGASASLRDLPLQ